MQICELCQIYGVPVRETNWEKRRKFDYEPYVLIKASTQLYQNSGEGVIVYGGHSTLPQLLGYRLMRKPSKDIDSVGKEEHIKELLENRGLYSDFHYGLRENQIILTNDSNIIIGTGLDRIHDWEVPQDFYDNSMIFSIPDIGNVRVASPEYQIMLKLRRGYENMGIKPFYGKDRIDIANILLAPYYRSGLREVDLNELSNLVRFHITDDRSCLEKLVELANLEKVDNLNKDERNQLKEVLTILYSSLLTPRR